MLNAFYECFALAWLTLYKGSMFRSKPSEVDLAEQRLIQNKGVLLSKEREFMTAIQQIDADIVTMRDKKPASVLQLKLKERKRYKQRLEKVQNSISVMDKHIDTLQSSELDKIIYDSLKLSSQALKKNVQSVKVYDVENVMSELDDHILEAGEVNQVLCAPLQTDDMGIIEEESELLEDDEVRELLGLAEKSELDKTTPETLQAEAQLVFESPTNHEHHRVSENTLVSGV